MRVFLDNCLSPRVAKALQVLVQPEHEVVHLSDKFQRDVDDQEWIRTLAREGNWIIISGDPRITRSAAERAAWRESGLTAFFLKRGWTNLRLIEQAARLILRWPKIIEQVRRANPGDGFLIPIKGELEEIKDPRQKKRPPSR